MLELIETKIYKTKVGLFIHNFDEPSGMGGNGRMLLAGSQVMYDQNNNGWHIFHVLEKDKPQYVKVPDYDLENEIKEIDNGNNDSK